LGGGVYVLTFSKHVNVSHVNKTVTDFGGIYTDIPPVATPLAMMHLAIKFCADIFIQSGVIDIFPKLKMAAVAILDLLGEPWDHPRRLIRGAYPL